MTWHPDIPLEYRDQIVTGDARELAARLPDASVDLIFTDPVYERIEDYAWLAEAAARVLKPDGHLLVWQQVSLLPATFDAMNTHMVYRWTLVMTRSNVATNACRTNFFTHWTPCIWFTKTPDVKPLKRFRDAVDDPYVVNPRVTHKWFKPSKPLRLWLPAFVPVGGVVYDPFTGSGSVPVECKKSGRHFIASEIEQEHVSRARARLDDTQPMHPVFLEEQAELAL
jgi:DNA modification methylase